MGIQKMKMLMALGNDVIQPPLKQGSFVKFQNLSFGVDGAHFSFKFDHE
jgi:hypothetical protein